MICTKCGKENQEGTNFCRYCGNPMQKDMYALIERAKKMTSRQYQRSIGAVPPNCIVW